MPPPKREIDEIVQLHVREGLSVQEVFVEGTEDKQFYEGFLAACGLHRVAVLDVGTVNVPDATLADLHLNLGKKGRVVALAALLEGRLQENQVVCIADADSDHFLGKTYGYALLLLTDFTSIELYVLCPTVIDRILRVALKGFPKRPEQVTTELAGLLRDSFIFRVAADDLNLGPTYPVHSSFCERDRQDRSFSFRIRDYINEAMKGRTTKEWQGPLGERIEERKSQLPSDVRKCIHGHDFVDTFAWYVRQHAGYGDLHGDTFSRLILGFVDSDSIANEPMLKELLRRLQMDQQRA
jgi:hypothetical protein